MPKAAISRSASRLLRLNGVRSSSVAPGIEMCTSRIARPLARIPRNSRSTKSRCTSVVSLPGPSCSTPRQLATTSMACPSITSASSVLSIDTTGISRSSELAFCDAENRRAMPTTPKPRARNSSVTKRPIRPEAPSTRILRVDASLIPAALEVWLGDHQPKDDHNRTEAGNAEGKPAAKQRKVTRWQHLALRHRLSREIAHFDLHEDHRNPEQPRNGVEHERGEEPALAERGRRQHHQDGAGDGLQDHRGQREQHVGDHHRRRGARDISRIATLMRHQHEEGDATAGTENDDGAEYMQIFDQEICRHGFFAAVGANSFSARSSSGPATFTPLSVSASQWPSLPEAASRRNSTLPPPARKASASCLESVGEK